MNTLKNTDNKICPFYNKQCPVKLCDIKNNFERCQYYNEQSGKINEMDPKKEKPPEFYGGF